MKRDSLFLYRKFLKSSKIVYNELEIKNDMTKERRLWLRHDVDYEVFCFGSGWLHYPTIEKISCEDGIRFKPKPPAFNDKIIIF